MIKILKFICGISQIGSHGAPTCFKPSVPVDLAPERLPAPAYGGLRSMKNSLCFRASEFFNVRLQVNRYGRLFLQIGIMFLLSFYFLDKSWAAGNSSGMAVVNFEPKNVAGNTTVTVGQMLARRSDQSWLSKAIGDLIIKNLSEVNALTVLERERMKTFLDEIGLKNSALMDQSRALEFGRVAKVGQVVYGNYEMNSGNIQITLFLLDLNTKQVIQTVKAEGALSQLQAIIKKLTLELLEKQKVALSDEELKRIRYQPTDSLSAIQHFYKGIDCYDRGLYADGLAEFMLALGQDPQYREAALWEGKMYEALSYERHAVQVYRDLFARFPASVEGRDALVFSGKLQSGRLGRPDLAVKTFEEVKALKPLSPHHFQALFCLGQLYESQNEWLKAFEAFKSIDDFNSQAQNDPALYEHTDAQRSRFFDWRHIAALDHDAVDAMVVNYQSLIDQLDPAQWPAPPRGVILLTKDKPEFNEQQFGHTPALQSDDHRYPDWREEMYVVIVPPETLVKAVRFTLAGRVKDLDPGYSFDISAAPYPLPIDFDHHRYGFLAGQTSQTSTLSKDISFYGQRERMFAVHLLQNHSMIESWGLKLIFADENEKRSPDFQNRVDDGFWEGKILGSVNFSRDRRFDSGRMLEHVFNSNKKDMDLIYHPVLGYIAVVSQGTLGAQPTDLFVSRSPDGKNWSVPAAPKINSQSEDYSPRLVRGEDDQIRLAWLSDRRGKGWELWLSALKPDGEWENSHRVPLESLVDPGLGDFYQTPEKLLEYDVYQDKQGRWLIAYYSYASQSIVIAASTDSFEWKTVSSQMTSAIPYGLSLVQDSSGVYRLGALQAGGKIRLYSSNELVRWTSRDFDISFWKQWWAPSPIGHRMRLFPLELGKLLMIVSDNEYGLQFARFQADSEEPLLDLVSEADLNAYGITEGPDGNFVVGFKDQEKIVFREYRQFNTSGEEVKKDTRDWPIYTTKEKDSEGSVWRHIVAQSRRRISDVTALGIENSGRVWWGMETGVMYKDGDRFFATDVSQGFFNNFITDIQTCSPQKTWFSSRELNRPQLGNVENNSRLQQASPQFKTVDVPDIKGAITAQACEEKDHFFVATSQGNIVLFNGKEKMMALSIPSEKQITALFYDRENKEIWAGTDGDGLYRADLNTKAVTKIDDPLVNHSEITGVTADKQNGIWASTHSGGILYFSDGKWQNFTPDNSDVPYWSVAKLVADPKTGIWYISGNDSPSRGLGYHDGKAGKMYNPPHHVLKSPSSLAVASDGSLWTGSWTDGVYQFDRSGQ